MALLVIKLVKIGIAPFLHIYNVRPEENIESALDLRFWQKGSVNYEKKVNPVLDFL